ncbi:phosphoglycerate kinase [Patescibacteria group bacterium]|nr:phosphoglycerate kinase [Patescibacteria group bacterium]MBU1702800.1 phosphoglycerate kinase [Patescibacteria group bacterium]MBU1953807.1 phosphoglycerate kinase [Patescibacteria group bacterium]
MKIKSVKTADLKDKRVLVRVDFNVPLENGKVADDTRITATLPTINYLLEKGAKVILMTHLGRPDGKIVDELKLDPLAEKLSELINKPVKKLADCIGPEVEQAVKSMQAGEIILLENTRFHAEEESCDKEFSKKLAALGDLFVIDSFGTAHRKHASTYGIAEHIPAYAGFLVEKEVNTLSELMQDTAKPFVVIMGGSKIETKIGVMKNFLGKADHFLVGGGLANTFLAAKGFNVAESLYEPDQLETAREIMLDAEAIHNNFHLPTDAVVADEIEDTAETLDIPVEDVEGSMKILDIGRNTITAFEEIIAKSGTIIWNGPVGLFEKEKFSRGTRHIAVAVAKATTISGAKSIIGGGDTIDAINNFGIDLNKYTHVSTGGGAMLEFLEGTMLPGIEIILEK